MKIVHKNIEDFLKNINNYNKERPFLIEFYNGTLPSLSDDLLNVLNSETCGILKRFFRIRCQSESSQELAVKNKLVEVSDRKFQNTIAIYNWKEFRINIHNKDLEKEETKEKIFDTLKKYIFAIHETEVSYLVLSYYDTLEESYRFKHISDKGFNDKIFCITKDENHEINSYKLLSTKKDWKKQVLRKFHLRIDDSRKVFLANKTDLGDNISWDLIIKNEDDGSRHFFENKGDLPSMKGNLTNYIRRAISEILTFKVDKIRECDEFYMVFPKTWKINVSNLLNRENFFKLLFKSLKSNVNGLFLFFIDRDITKTEILKIKQLLD